MWAYVEPATPSEPPPPDEVLPFDVLPATVAPDEAPPAVRRTIPDPDLVRTGAAAALGMVLLAVVLGTAGGIALLWLGTRMLVYLR